MDKAGVVRKECISRLRDGTISRLLRERNSARIGGEVKPSQDGEEMIFDN
jgi:hypothetical protein